MYIRRLLYGSTAKVFISILLGLGLASLFRKVCKDRECIVFKAPNLSELKEKIYKYGEKCYTFKENAQTCDEKKKIIPFA